MLGPISFVNHDCDSNCEYIMNEKNEMLLITKRSIKKGEEITTDYGKNYFDFNNTNCECSSCEKTGLGIYKKNSNKYNNEECHISIQEESEEVCCDIFILKFLYYHIQIIYLYFCHTLAESISFPPGTKTGM